MFQNCVEVYIHLVLIFQETTAMPSRVEKEFYTFLQAIAHAKQSPIVKINGTDDHLHILLKLYAQVSIDDIVQMLKACGASWLKLHGHPHFSWQEGYGVFSCSLNHIQSLSDYIGNQKEHHAILTFAHEMSTLTKAWGVKWRFNPNG